MTTKKFQDSSSIPFWFFLIFLSKCSLSFDRFGSSLRSLQQRIVHRTVYLQHDDQSFLLCHFTREHKWTLEELWGNHVRIVQRFWISEWNHWQFHYRSCNETCKFAAKRILRDSNLFVFKFCFEQKNEEILSVFPQKRVCDIFQKQLHEWRLAFWITCGVCGVTTVIYALFSSTERQKFDYDEEELAAMQNS